MYQLDINVIVTVLAEYLPIIVIYIHADGDGIGIGRRFTIQPARGHTN